MPYRRVVIKDGKVAVCLEDGTVEYVGDEMGFDWNGDAVFTPLNRNPMNLDAPAQAVPRIPIERFGEVAHSAEDLGLGGIRADVPIFGGFR